MGIGAAGVSAPALAIIATMFAPEDRAGAIGVFVVFGAAGLTIGPIAGGLLLDHFWWGSVFLVNVPIVLLGVIVGAATIPESRAPEGRRARRLDGVGAGLSVAGLSLLLFGVIEGPGRGWTSPATLVALAGGAVVILTFVRRELAVRFPLFDVRIIVRPVILTGSITLFLAYLLFSTFLFLVPQSLQDVSGESILAVGLLLVPFAVVFGLCSTRAPTALARFGPRRTITSGLVVSAVSAAAAAAAVGRSVAGTVVASMLLGAGLSLLIAPPSTVVMNDLPEEKAGDGSSLNFVSRFVGAAVGIAVTGSVLATIYASHLSSAVNSLGAGNADTAEGSLQGALTVAGTLDPAPGNALADAARDAFTTGATVAYAVTGLLGLLAALWAWRALRVGEA